MTSKAANYHEFKTLPENWTRAKWGPPKDEYGGRDVLNNDEPYKWSGENDPPAIGAKVKLFMNDFKGGTVTSYFAEYGWLGVLVKISKPPLWWVKQTRERGDNPATTPGHFFGIDLEPRTKEKNDD